MVIVKAALALLAWSCVSVLSFSSAFAQVQDDRHEAYAKAHIAWSLYHETGHAIQDFTADRLTMSKQEMEDHADKIAAFLMLPKRQSPEEFQLYHDAAFDLYMDTDPPDPTHQYAPSRVRAERMFCMLYGAYPDSPWTGIAQELKNRADADCISDYRSFRQETVDILGFAREFTALDDPQIILPRLLTPAAHHADAHAFLVQTDILDDLAIDVEEWLPGLQVSDKRFQIVAQECAGYDGFRYVWDQSAVIACFAAVQRCMKRPGHLLALVDAISEIAASEETGGWDESEGGDEAFED